MTRRAWCIILSIACLILVARITAPVIAQTYTYRFNDVAYRFPSVAGSTGAVLLNDGTGQLAWANVSVPAGTIVWSTTGSCPTGWSEDTSARGRYIVGLVSGGTNGGTAGTALTDNETRATGQHNHLVSDPGHTHPQNSHTHVLSGTGSHAHSSTASSAVAHSTVGGTTVPSATATTSTGASTTGITFGSTAAGNQSAVTSATVANAGSVAGTNAPYVQLVTCSKD